MGERFLIVGGGTMGAGIAYVAARGGYDVDVVEPLVAARARATALIEREAERSGDRSTLERVRWLDAIPETSDAVLAIEAVPERFELKRDSSQRSRERLLRKRCSRRIRLRFPFAISPTLPPIPRESSACTSSIRRQGCS